MNKLNCFFFLSKNIMPLSFVIQTQFLKYLMQLYMRQTCCVLELHSKYATAPICFFNSSPCKAQIYFKNNSRVCLWKTWGSTTRQSLPNQSTSLVYLSVKKDYINSEIAGYGFLNFSLPQSSFISFNQRGFFQTQRYNLTHIYLTCASGTEVMNVLLR